MALRRKKSKKNQAMDLLESYLKLQAAKKTAKGAGKAAKGTAVYKVAKKTPMVRRIPVVLGAGIAALAAFKIVRSRGGGEPTPA